MASHPPGYRETAPPIPIALVTASFEPGGTEHQMMELIERLDRSRWQVHVATLRTSGGLLARAARAAPIVTFPVGSFRRAECARQLVAFAGWCRRRRIALVHTLDTPSNIFGLAGAALARVPVRIANRRDVNPGRTAVALAIQRAAYGAAHTIVANCRAAADRLRLERVPADRIAIVPNGIDATRFSRRHPGDGQRRIVTVSNLRAEKGHDVLIDAAAIVLARFPDARFELVGGGPLLASLRETVAARGLERSVALLGHRDRVEEHLRAAEMFVLPSRSEAFPNALLEAMAAGLPVVASAVGGIPELVADGEHGLLIPPGDPARLAGRICELLDDPVRAAGLGGAAQRHVSTHYSFDRMVAGFETVYERLLTDRGVLPGRTPVAAA